MDFQKLSWLHSLDSVHKSGMIGRATVKIALFKSAVFGRLHQGSETREGMKRNPHFLTTELSGRSAPPWNLPGNYEIFAVSCSSLLLSEKLLASSYLFFLKKTWLLLMGNKRAHPGMQQVEMGVKILHFKQFHSVSFYCNLKNWFLWYLNLWVCSFMIKSHDTFTVFHQSLSSLPCCRAWFISLPSMNQSLGRSLNPLLNLKNTEWL